MRIQFTPVVLATIFGLASTAHAAHAALDPAKFEYVTVRKHEAATVDRTATTVLDTFVADEATLGPGQTHFLEGRFIAHLANWNEVDAAAVVHRLREVLAHRAQLSSTYYLGATSWVGVTSLTEDELFERVNRFANDAAMTDDDRVIYTDKFLQGLCEDIILAPRAN